MSKEEILKTPTDVTSVFRDERRELQIGKADSTGISGSSHNKFLEPIPQAENHSNAIKQPPIVLSSEAMFDVHKITKMLCNHHRDSESLEEGKRPHTAEEPTKSELSKTCNVVIIGNGNGAWQTVDLLASEVAPVLKDPGKAVRDFVIDDDFFENTTSYLCNSCSKIHIIVVRRSPTRIGFTSVAEAEAHNYFYFDINSNLDVRFPSAVHSIAPIAGRGRTAAISAHQNRILQNLDSPVEQFDLFGENGKTHDEIRSLFDSTADLIISAGGYKARIPELFGPDGAKMVVAKDNDGQTLFSWPSTWEENVKNNSVDNRKYFLRKPYIHAPIVVTESHGLQPSLIMFGLGSGMQVRDFDTRYGFKLGRGGKNVRAEGVAGYQSDTGLMFLPSLLRKSFGEGAVVVDQYAAEREARDKLLQVDKFTFYSFENEIYGRFSRVSGNVEDKSNLVNWQDDIGNDWKEMKLRIEDGVIKVKSPVEHEFVVFESGVPRKIDYLDFGGYKWEYQEINLEHTNTSAAVQSDQGDNVLLENRTETLEVAPELTDEKTLQVTREIDENYSQWREIIQAVIGQDGRGTKAVNTRLDDLIIERNIIMQEITPLLRISEECHKTVLQKGLGWWATKKKTISQVLADAAGIFEYHLRAYLPKLEFMIINDNKKNVDSETVNSTDMFSIKILDIGAGLGLYNALVYWHYQLEFAKLKSKSKINKHAVLNIELNFLDQDGDVDISESSVSRQHLDKWYSSSIDDVSTKGNGDTTSLIDESSASELSVFYGDLDCALRSLVSSGIPRDSVKLIQIPTKSEKSEKTIHGRTLKIHVPDSVKTRGFSEHSSYRTLMSRETDGQYNLIFSTRTYCWIFPCETDNYGALITRKLKPYTGRFFVMARCNLQALDYFRTRYSENKVLQCSQRPHVKLPLISCRSVDAVRHGERYAFHNVTRKIDYFRTDINGPDCILSIK